MEAIRSSECEAGKWYELGGQRMLCLGPSRLHDGCTAMVRHDYAILNYSTFMVTPLPDCTGWDWQPEPKYRPFKDAAELLKYGEFKRITYYTLAGGSYQCGVGMVDLRTGQDSTICRLWDATRGWSPWLSAQNMLDQCTFTDTGEPCGVRL